MERGEGRGVSKEACGFSLVSVFMFSDFYRLDLLNRTRIALAKFVMKHQKKRKKKKKKMLKMDWKWGLPWFSYGCQKCMFCWLLDVMHSQVLPIVFIIECRIVVIIWRPSPVFFEHICGYYRSNIRVWLKTVTRRWWCPTSCRI